MPRTVPNRYRHISRYVSCIVSYRAPPPAPSAISTHSSMADAAQSARAAVQPRNVSQESPASWDALQSQLHPVGRSVRTPHVAPEPSVWCFRCTKTRGIGGVFAALSHNSITRAAANTCSRLGRTLGWYLGISVYRYDIDIYTLYIPYIYPIYRDIQKKLM